MKIAIMGGAGFVGSRLTRAYLDAGHDVLVIDNLARGLREDVDGRARFYQLDIRDPEVQQVLRQERPDVVSHHAALCGTAFPAESLLADADVQLRGLLNVLDGCVSAFVTKFIYASNGSTLYQPIPISGPEQHSLHIVREDIPLRPQCPGAINKLAGEWYVRHYAQEHGLVYTVLRYAQIYGESRREWARHPATYFVDMLARDERPVIRGSASDVRDHIHIDDVARANLRILEHGRNSTMHISSGQGYTLAQLFEVAAAQCSSDLLPVYIGSATTEPTALILDNTLARQLLDWQPQIDMAEGIRQAVEALCGQAMPSQGRETPAHAPVLDAVLAHA